MHQQATGSPRDGLRLNVDLIEFCTRHLPKWVPVSIAAYNAADSRLNDFEELGALMANAAKYLDGIVARGNLEVADVAHGVGGVTLRTSMDFFEDIAKLRAARSMWGRPLRERYQVTDERASRLRIHVVTAGSAMTYTQPLNNIARGTLIGLAETLTAELEQRAWAFSDSTCQQGGYIAALDSGRHWIQGGCTPATS